VGMVIRVTSLVAGELDALNTCSRLLANPQLRAATVNRGACQGCSALR
jgi:hypothetical protein